MILFLHLFLTSKMSTNLESYSIEDLYNNIYDLQRRELLMRLEEYVKTNGHPPSYRKAIAKLQRSWRGVPVKNRESNDEVVFALLAEKPLDYFALPPERELIKRILNK